MKKGLILLLPILVFSVFSYSQQTSKNVNSIYKQGLDSIIKYIENEGPFVYHDWVKIGRKDTMRNFFQTRLKRLHLKVYVDTNNYFVNLSQYSAKKIFEYFIKDIDKGAQPTVFYKDTFPVNIQADGIFMLPQNKRRDDTTRFKKRGLFYEIITIETSQIFTMDNEFAILSLSVTRGNNTHGLSYFFFYRFIDNEWKLQDTKREESIYSWLQRQ